MNLNTSIVVLYGVAKFTENLPVVLKTLLVPYNTDPDVDADHRRFSQTISELICFQGWIQFFYICTYLWTFCYALDIYRLVHDMEP